MSKLNKRNTSRVIKNKSAPIGVSYNGNIQYVKDAAQQLYELVVSTLYGKDTYYESTDQRLKRMVDCVNSVVRDGKISYVANLIVHARKVMNIRSMPILLTVYFAKALRDNKVEFAQMRQLVRDVIERADQLTDIYAVALEVFGDKSKIPTAIKRGVGDAFNKFNEYQLAKYSREGTVKIKDVLRIVHPVAFDLTQGQLFQKVVEDSLATPYTWETELSANGNKPVAEQKSKDQLWSELIDSGKIGYMALLRNLRNIVSADVSTTTINKVCKILADPEQVAKSKQFPFAFINAIKALDVNKIKSSTASRYWWAGSQTEAHVYTGAKVDKLVEALATAVEHSLGNLPHIGDNVWAIVDVSSSMAGIPVDTACLFAAALAKAHKSATEFALSMFSDRAEVIRIRRSDSVLTIYEHLIKKVYGGGTNLDSALSQKKELGFEPDTVVIFSDMQVDALTRKDPMKMFNKNVVKVAINMNGYATTPCHEVGHWMQLSGWSEKLFDFIPALRDGETIVTQLSGPYVAQKVRLPWREKVVEEVEPVKKRARMTTKKKAA